MPWKFPPKQVASLFPIGVHEPLGETSLFRMKSKFWQFVTLVFSEPAPIYDTVLVDPKDLKRGIVHNLTGAVLFNYGDTTIDVIVPKQCTKRYQVTVKDPTPIDNVDAEQNGARKQILNGRIIIFVDERKYNIVGQQID